MFSSFTSTHNVNASLMMKKSSQNNESWKSKKETFSIPYSLAYKIYKPHLVEDLIIFAGNQPSTYEHCITAQKLRT